MTDDEVEAVASAFYVAEFDSANWRHAPEPVKEQFRVDARAAIAEILQDETSSHSGAPIYFDHGFMDMQEQRSGYLH